MKAIRDLLRNIREAAEERILVEIGVLKSKERIPYNIFFRLSLLQNKKNIQMLKTLSIAHKSHYQIIYGFQSYKSEQTYNVM